MSTFFHVDHLDFRHPAYPADRKPLTVLFVSDMHFRGPGSRARELRDWMAARTYDVVLFGGDYQYGHGLVSDQTYEAIMEVIRAAHGRWGVYGCSGNHDHPTLVTRLERETAFHLAENAWFHLDGPLHVAVIGDAWQNRHDAAKAVTGIPHVPQGAFTLGVAHSPDAAHSAAAAGVHVLFCGHTHGGQVVLPFVGPPMKRLRIDRRLVSGEFRLNRMLLHVSMGVGASLFSLRYGTRSSVAEIVIRHGALRENRVRRIFPKGFFSRR